MYFALAHTHTGASTSRNDARANSSRELVFHAFLIHECFWHIDGRYPFAGVPISCQFPPAMTNPLLISFIQTEQSRRVDLQQYEEMGSIIAKVLTTLL